MSFNSHILRDAGRMIYGPNLQDWIYIRVLARDFGVAENTVNRWWYDETGYLAPAAQSAIANRIDRYEQSHPDRKKEKAERLAKSARKVV